MADTDRYRNALIWSSRARSAVTGLPRTKILQATAGVAVVMLGLAATGGANWAVAAARESMQGRMALYARYTPHASMVHVGFIEIADNTP